MSSPNLDNALSEFFSECDEIIQRFTSQLSKLEKDNKNDPSVIDALYRDMHTMKGTAQLFGFQHLGQVAHAMEASLEPIRRLKLMIPSGLMDALFKSIDLLERILKQINSTNPQIDASYNEEIQKWVTILINEATKIFDGEITLFKETLSFPEDVEMYKVNLMNQTEVVLPEKSEFKSKEINMKDEIKVQLKEEDIVSNADANSTIRIQVSLLDRLMNLVGEMVLVRNQVLQYSQQHDDLDLLNLSQRLDLVTSELQGEVMKTRMQPIGSILSKFQRVIRDIARDLSKQIEMSVVGSETELDKTLLEAIKDPLTHIIRNSCDHGLESPADRASAGKPAVGHIQIKSYHEGGQVIIEISDDGRGLNYKRIVDKALEKNLITADKAKTLSDREIGNLIFAAGFSTAEQVSAVSGRGVGMDVVKTNLEKVGGQVELQSEPGKGMTVRMKIPLTLAIVPALIIKVKDEQFAIPQVKLAELVRVEKGGAGLQIEMLQGKPVFRLRGKLLPLVNLSEVMQIPVKESVSLASNEKNETINIVVLNGDNDTFGLIVDEIKDTADIVVKPLSQFLKRISIYSGATIMGDGAVSLILDITGIALKSNLFQKANKKEFSVDSAALNKKTLYNKEVHDFLFFKLNSEEIYGVPLCLVNRLEEFPTDEIEYSGSQRIVKYRDAILPLISLNEIMKLNNSRSEERDKISVIVVQKRDRMFGIEVNEIADIVSVQGSLEDPIRETFGVLGSIIVERNVVTAIDVLSILDSITNTSSKPGKVSKRKDEESDNLETTSSHILFAEDTVFFMKQVAKILQKNGYKFTHVPDGQEAWNLLNNSKPDEFQLVLTDIEMPNMNGFQLAEKIRSDSRFTKIPLIALTTKFREVDVEQGHKVGFSKYLEKLKSDQLIEAVNGYLRGK